MKMYVWSDQFSFLAAAHAESVAEARKLVLMEMGVSGDGSCLERDKVRRFVLEIYPSVWFGTNAEFVLSDSAKLREQAALLERVQAELRDAKAQLKALMEYTHELRMKRQEQL